MDTNTYCILDGMIYVQTLSKTLSFHKFEQKHEKN